MKKCKGTEIDYTVIEIHNITFMLSQNERVFAGFDENDQPTGGQYHKTL